MIINLGSTKSFEHKGIKLELIGLIESPLDKKISSRFIGLGFDIEPLGILSKEVNTYEFKYASVEKQFETYYGKTMNVKYILRLTIETKFKSLTYDQEFAVQNPMNPDILKNDNNPIKLEVGIDEWLHLSFELFNRNFAQKDIASGKVTFKKVSLRLLGMEVQLIKKETIVGAAQPDTQILAKYEIMDGGPIKHETIPIRLFMKPYELTPTMNNVSNRFSVQYFVNIVLTDVEDRKYFKQHEIFIFRIEKIKKPAKMFQNVAGSVINALPGQQYNAPSTEVSSEEKPSEPEQSEEIKLD